MKNNKSTNEENRINNCVFPKSINMPAPFCGIRFITLTDGTVYENNHYEFSKRLTSEQYEIIFLRAALELCNNIPERDGSMSMSFEDAAF